MTDDDLTGPWVLALGALAVGVAAVAAEARRRRRGNAGHVAVESDDTSEER